MKLRPLSLALAGALGIAAALPAAAATTVSVGIERTTGEYGTDTRTTETIIPFALKHENGPWTFKFTVPWVRVEGPGNPNSAIAFEDNSGSGSSGSGGGSDDNARARALAGRSESGLGDMTVSGFYNIFNDPARSLGVDVGLKAKFATADKDKRTLTTGENDYSIQGDFYFDFKPVPKTTAFGTLGWTKKGDPDGIDYRNPFYASVGFSYKLDDKNSWGAAYDYRQKVLDGRDPVSETSVFFTHRYSQVLKVQAYALREFFSDSSPDLGGGVTVFYSF